MQIKNSNRGFAPIIIILIVVGVLALGGGVWYAKNKIKTQAPEEENYQVSTPPQTQKQTSQQTTTTQQTIKPDETAGWKTYRNEKYGFEVKYPADWKFEGGFLPADFPGAIEYFTIGKRNGAWEGGEYGGGISITILKGFTYDNAKSPPSAEIKLATTVSEKRILIDGQPTLMYSYIIPNTVIGWSGSDHIKTDSINIHLAILKNELVYQIRGRATKGDILGDDVWGKIDKILSTFKFIK